MLPASKRSTDIQLSIRQQPEKARMCSFKEKVDRRPVDPPPIIQVHFSHYDTPRQGIDHPYMFVYATLVDGETNKDLHMTENGTRTMAGTVVQSLHRLKDDYGQEGAFAVFSDINIRVEGWFKLKFTLFDIIGAHVQRLCSVTSALFQVFSPKVFPGMSESTSLTRCFADQGVRIRVRKETRTIKRRRCDEPPLPSPNDILHSFHDGMSLPRPSDPHFFRMQPHHHPHHPQNQYQKQHLYPASSSDSSPSSSNPIGMMNDRNTSAPSSSSLTPSFARRVVLPPPRTLEPSPHRHHAHNPSQATTHHHHHNHHRYHGHGQPHHANSVRSNSNHNNSSGGSSNDVTSMASRLAFSLRTDP
ncbi:velvet factor-domain-containing protein [Syncephalastrum racemosum]|uniref:Velvet factor-domain-containing protein n=1 Tax=Syncephalastrum racemosum TaxID=13706 RepID=A0A1X2HJF1_SYNRA|nr:velvet factor-domain-containing protein [Syncephalastrum racemosum]